MLLFFLTFLLSSSVHAGTLKGRVKERADGIVVAVKKIKCDVQPPKGHAIISQKNMEFIPNVLPVLVGTTVDFPNDEVVIYHNVFSVSEGNRFDLGTYRVGEIKSVTFKKTGIVEVLCNIHVRMYAAIIVLDNPYFTRVEAGGSYSIKDIPKGAYTVEIYFVKNHTVVKKQSRVVIPDQGVVERNL